MADQPAPGRRRGRSPEENIARARMYLLRLVPPQDRIEADAHFENALAVARTAGHLPQGATQVASPPPRVDGLRLDWIRSTIDQINVHLRGRANRPADKRWSVAARTAVGWAADEAYQVIAGWLILSAEQRQQQLRGEARVTPRQLEVELFMLALVRSVLWKSSAERAWLWTVFSGEDSLLRLPPQPPGPRQGLHALIAPFSGDVVPLYAVENPKVVSMAKRLTLDPGVFDRLRFCLDVRCWSTWHKCSEHQGPLYIDKSLAAATNPSRGCCAPHRRQAQRARQLLRKRGRVTD